VQVIETSLPGVLLIKPRVLRDARGFFMETFQAERYAEAGIRGPFVQDNLSHSTRGTLRGLHFQEPSAQGKLVQVIRGAVHDVAVDVRRGSPTFGRWERHALDDASGHQLWIPPGFAHGFVVLSESCDFLYKCTDYWRPECERSIAWDDPDLAIDWELRDPVLSAKDAGAPRLADAPVLPNYPG